MKLLHNPGNSSNDINFNNHKIFKLKTTNITTNCGQTIEVEDPLYQKKLKTVCVLWNHVPEEIILKNDKKIMSFKFVMTLDDDFRVAKQEMIDGKIKKKIKFNNNVKNKKNKKNTE